MNSLLEQLVAQAKKKIPPEGSFTAAEFANKSESNECIAKRFLDKQVSLGLLKRDKFIVGRIVIYYWAA